jgi:signal peptidase I
MEPSAPVNISAPKPVHRRWVGVLLSLLIAGAGIFLAGDRKAGLRWFLGLTILSLVTVALAPLPAIPGLLVFVALAAVLAILTLWMLVLSYRPVPKLGVRGWVLFLVLAALLGGLEALIPQQLARAFKVSSGSMEPTILPGDRLLVQMSAYWFAAPSRNDVVVFRTDAMASAGLPQDQFWVKRIVGLPGEAIQVADGHLLINGHPPQLSPVLADQNFSLPPEPLLEGTNSYVVPAGCYFLVGDNVASSLDSRRFGAVPRHGIIGRATKVYWPAGRAGDIQ